MLLERVPGLIDWPIEEKALLAEELLNAVQMEQERDPAILDLLRQRLHEHEASPETGIPWETLRDRLLKK